MDEVAPLYRRAWITLLTLLDDTHTSKKDYLRSLELMLDELGMRRDMVAAELKDEEE